MCTICCHIFGRALKPPTKPAAGKRTQPPKRKTEEKNEPAENESNTRSKKARVEKSSSSKPKPKGKAKSKGKAGK